VDLTQCPEEAETYATVWRVFWEQFDEETPEIPSSWADESNNLNKDVVQMFKDRVQTAREHFYKEAVAKFRIIYPSLPQALSKVYRTNEEEAEFLEERKLLALPDATMEGMQQVLNMLLVNNTEWNAQQCVKALGLYDRMQRAYGMGNLSASIEGDKEPSRAQFLENMAELVARAMENSDLAASHVVQAAVAEAPRPAAPRQAPAGPKAPAKKEIWRKTLPSHIPLAADTGGSTVGKAPKKTTAGASKTASKAPKKTMAEAVKNNAVGMAPVTAPKKTTAGASKAAKKKPNKKKTAGTAPVEVVAVTAPTRTPVQLHKRLFNFSLGPNPPASLSSQGASRCRRSPRPARRARGATSAPASKKGPLLSPKLSRRTTTRSPCERRLTSMRISSAH
jgi:hypothetical protein